MVREGEEKKQFCHDEERKEKRGCENESPMATIENRRSFRFFPVSFFRCLKMTKGQDVSSFSTMPNRIGKNDNDERACLFILHGLYFDL